MKIAFQPLENSPLFGLKSKQKLAHTLGVPLRDLRQLTKELAQYKEWNHKKASGGTRLIEHPRPILKAIQKKIARLLSSIEPPDYLLCPVRGRSAFDNAIRHGDGRSVVTIDLRSFFASAAESRVVWLFKTYMGCSPDVAYLLTKLVTHNGHLPTGAPSSPIVSHFAYRDLWDEIDDLCRGANLKLSVWIDDITVSGDRVPGELTWQIRQTIARYRLRYHSERRSDGKPSRVTGVILHPDGSLALPHRHHRKVHAIKSETAAAMARADARSVKKLDERLAGMRGQEVQLRRIAATAKKAVRNLGGNEGTLNTRAPSASPRGDKGHKSPMVANMEAPPAPR